jgi:hypothetical protein
MSIASTPDFLVSATATKQSVMVEANTLGRAVQFCADRTRYRAERVYLVGGVA